MNGEIKEPKTLQEAILYFGNPDNCLAYLAKKRWPDGVVVCPTCGSTQVHFLATRRLWQCVNEHPRRQFSIKVGTIMEDSAIPIEKWLCATWMIVNDKNGISSYELHRALGVTQKSAWFMAHRIRLALQRGSFAKLGGRGVEVEADETFIGGKARNMHLSEKQRRITSTGPKGKQPVWGVLERGGDVRCVVVPTTRKPVIQPLVKEHVAAESALYTDALLSYKGMEREYAHGVIDHAVAYVNGRVHTNGLENFWSLLKRSLGGTYVSVEPFHLFRYLDEQSFRYNNRGTKKQPVNDGQRFRMALSNIPGRRLTYAELTGKLRPEAQF